MRASKPTRRGYSIVAVLALFAMAGSLFIVWTRGAVQQHEQQRRVQEHRQADWLASGALSRAAARHAADSAYEGETWRLSAADLHQPYDAEITISITTQNDRARCTAVVDLPPGEGRRVRVSRSAMLPSHSDNSDPNPGEPNDN